MSPLVSSLALGINRETVEVRDRERHAGCKPTVLILRYRYYAPGSTEDSSEKNHLDNTLQASGLGIARTLTYDDDLPLPPRNDILFLKTCIELNPALVVLSSWSAKDPHHPSKRAISLVRRKLGIPVAVIWWDSCSEEFWRSIHHSLDMADVHVVVDNPARTYLDQDSIFFDRFLVLWPPQDENLFRVSEIKDINVSFLGQISSYRSYRAELIRFLIDAGVDGYFSTRDRAQQVTHEQYADVYARSFMSINFSASVSCDQFKSRILEIMYSGAMLLESENDQISRYFTPFVHYVPFTDKDDLLDKIAYYEAHPQERDRIARAGHDKAREQYNARHFWESIFLKAGVPVQPIQ